MKKMMMILAMMMAIATSASAMTYAEARHEALFLTDKMAYELNLTDYQYEMVYNINLEYLRYIDRGTVFGNPWALRNRRLADVLTATQYRLYEMANYFYRPVNWSGTTVHFSVYTRYADRNHFYRPAMRQTVTRRTGTINSARPYSTIRTDTRQPRQNMNTNTHKPQTSRSGNVSTRTQTNSRSGNSSTPKRTGAFNGQRK